MAEACTWCGANVEPDDGFRLYEPAGERRAAFCRLEHIVPWGMRGPHWEPGAMEDPAATSGLGDCAHCGEPLGEVHVVLVRHRGGSHIPDAFCSVDHLLDWSKAGGRWQ